jgi:glycosyltransferase involved in cell wall biosynthesis
LCILKKLAIITSHPIQYNAPLFKMLAGNGIIRIKVFYTWGRGGMDNKTDPGFGQIVQWNIPLLEGYEHCFADNKSTDPGTHHFKGIVNPTLIGEIESWQPDAILVFGWSFHSHLKCIRHFHDKIPVLFRGDSTQLDETPGLKEQIRRMFLKWVYRHIDRAIFVGENNRQYFLAHGLKEEQLIYAPHAIDNDRFAEPAKDYEQQAAEIRRNAGIEEDDLVLLFAGKLEQKKNPLFLVKLLNSFPGERLKVLFVGSGAMLPELESAARDDNRIRMNGFQNQQQMPAIYRAADLFILPSIGPGETWGLAVNEAMACGRAVAVSNKAGGAIDLVEEGVNGLILDLNNDEPVKTLIRQSLKDKKELAAMGWQSKLQIQAFTFQHIARAIEETVGGMD